MNAEDRRALFLVERLEIWDVYRRRGSCSAQSTSMYEAARPTWNDAVSFLDLLRHYSKEDYIESYMSRLRFQIREVFLDAGEELTDASPPADVERAIEGRCWCFNADGRLLWTLPDPDEGRSEFERFEYDGKYQVGDVVYVVPQASDPESESVDGDFGVVARVPADKQEWLRASRDPAEWDGCYRVHYVDTYGYLDDYDVPERCLTMPSSPLPDELKFLDIWSRLLKGTACFPQGLRERILERKVFLLNIEKYDFSKR